MNALATALSALAVATAPPAAGRYVDLPGLRMYCEVHGEGRPLVLLHGGGSTVQTSFGALLPLLARRHRVIAPEQQGHGHTPDADRPLSFEQMADDTAALLERLGVRDADVLGYSNGGLVAMQLARRHPALVRRLVLASSYFERSGMPPAFWQGFETARLEDMPAALREAHRAVAPGPDGMAAMFTKTVAMMKAFRDWPEEALRGIRGPSLVMVGDADVMSVEHAARMARLLPGGRLAVFPGSTHGTYLGAAEGARPGSPLPGLAVAMIEAFLAEP
ncbi:MAG TPA: alpha/beta hydrolase [Anaeromyxobacteraceae bacterium]|nr:alpha/beta hydrolase [Anaeromyxobacteraceae bacterium]